MKDESRRRDTATRGCGRHAQGPGGEEDREEEKVLYDKHPRVALSPCLRVRSSSFILPPSSLSFLDLDLNNPVFDYYPKSFDSLTNRQTLSVAHIKLPAVEAALEHMSAKKAFAEWRTAMRARILAGVELTIDVVKSQLLAVWKVHCGHAAWG